MSMMTAVAPLGCPRQINGRHKPGTGRQGSSETSYTISGAHAPMTPTISITAAHWVYLAGIAAVVLTMVLRANVVVPSIVATFAVALAWTLSPVAARASIFNASFVAVKELFNIFLVIAL